MSRIENFSKDSYICLFPNKTNHLKEFSQKMRQIHI